MNDNLFYIMNLLLNCFNLRFTS